MKVQIQVLDMTITGARMLQMGPGVKMQMERACQAAPTKPSVIFVTYLLYGLARPWVSRKWRREIEIEQEVPDTESIDETAVLSGSEDEMDAARILDADRRGV